MSELRVDSVKSKGGGAPDLPKGVTISGIATAATLGATTVDVSNVNVSGVVTSGTLSGNLLSTGTPTLGLGVTINSSGVAISGVATAGIVSATTLYGDGTNLTGIGASIAPLFYQPDPGDTGVSFPAGIGITFNQQVKAGTGNVTLSIANAGVAGTVVENFGVGSSITISENRVSFTPASDLSVGGDYIITYPSGCFTNNEGTDYVGTAYTFQARTYEYQLWAWGFGNHGGLGQNNTVWYSSPVQIPGTNWGSICAGVAAGGSVKTDGTLWMWGQNNLGQLGQNNLTKYSSPVQVPGDWTGATICQIGNMTKVIKSNGELWMWGQNSSGVFGTNQSEGSYPAVSSPVQAAAGTNWAQVGGANENVWGIKTDGTYWGWGQNEYGEVGDGSKTDRSSPVQIPGTTWKQAPKNAAQSMGATKTDGTLWTWGRNQYGDLGVGNETQYVSPVQVPGTTWDRVSMSTGSAFGMAIKTDGTLWTWGYNGEGVLGQNNNPGSTYSPVQVGSSTDWDADHATREWGMGTKNCHVFNDDGELWVWGNGTWGQIDNNQAIEVSAPIQITSDTTWHALSIGAYSTLALKKI